MSFKGKRPCKPMRNGMILTFDPHGIQCATHIRFHTPHPWFAEGQEGKVKSFRQQPEK
jgi:hypothetical protein